MHLQNHHVIISLYEGGTPFAGIGAGPPTAFYMKKAAPKELGKAPTHVCIHTPRILRPSVISGCSIKGESAI